jgi:hypothetical protein
VEIDKQERFFGTLEHFFDSKNLRKLFFITVVPYPVQIIANETASIVPVNDTIRIEHGDQLEDKILPSFLHLGTVSEAIKKGTR